MHVQHRITATEDDFTIRADRAAAVDVIALLMEAILKISSTL
jgi:hypothetical protein